MTAVSPYVVPLETVIDIEDGKTWEPVSLFVKNNNDQQTAEGVDDKVVPKRKMTIAEGISPLLTSMKLFGLYSSRRSENVDDDLDKNPRKWNAYRVYAVTVVILLWLNVVRMLSVFTREEKFGMILFGKLIIVSWSIQCATSQSAFYAASFSGRLAVLLHQPLDDSCAKHARKVATVYSVIDWSVIMLGSSFFAYGLFFTKGYKDSLLTPLQTHIEISDALVPRIIAYFSTFYLLSAFTFAQTITFVLAMIFSHQFKKVTQTLELRLDNQQRHVSDSDIETFRQKHQEISMNVDYVDDCLMFSNAAAFCCQLASLIILLYNLIFYTSFVTDPVIITWHIIWMFTLSFGLMLTAGGGIVLHHYVSLIQFVFFIRPPDIDMPEGLQFCC